VALGEDRGRSLEVRRPKSENRKKAEIRVPKELAPTQLQERHDPARSSLPAPAFEGASLQTWLAASSDFVLRTSDFFRPSAFGAHAQLAAHQAALNRRDIRRGLLSNPQ